MSCPDWISAVAARERGEEPADWAGMVEHLDGCKECRSEALAADPLLVFRRLPGVELTAAEERSEIEAMQQAVAAMRAAERVSATRRWSVAGWRRWAAAAVLALASLSVSWDKAPHVQPQAAAAKPIQVPQVIAPVGLDLMDNSARVYHLKGKDTTVTWIVGENIDV